MNTHPGTPVSDRCPCIGKLGCSTTTGALQAAMDGNCSPLRTSAKRTSRRMLSRRKLQARGDEGRLEVRGRGRHVEQAEAAGKRGGGGCVLGGSRPGWEACAAGGGYMGRGRGGPCRDGLGHSCGKQQQVRTVSCAGRLPGLRAHTNWPVRRRALPPQPAVGDGGGGAHVALPAPSFMCEGLRAAHWYLMGALCVGSAPTGYSAM